MRLFRKHPRRPMTLSERLYRRFVLKYHGHYLIGDLQLAAKEESIAYIRQHMKSALIFRDRWDLLEFALENAPPTGLLMEFGVEKGDSLRHLARRTSREIHGFDSFEGLPEHWAGTYEQRGKFTRGGQRPQVPDTVKLHVGWFDKTLPDFLQSRSEPAAFIHVDCDIYSSTKTVLEGLAPRMVPGTILVFDEYFNYPNWREHEYKAFQEFVARYGVKYDYIGFCEKNGHVAVKLVALGNIPRPRS